MVVPTTAATATTFLGLMETGWRACVKNGGRPDTILAGAGFIDAYIAALTLNGQQITYAGGEARKIDGGVSGIYFKGIEIQWCPEFDDNFGGAVSPAIHWTKRCYFLNTKHLKYRDDDMDIVTPVRPHDTLAMYAMVNLRMALSTSRRNAQAVLAIA